MKDWKEEEVIANINSGVDKQKAFLEKYGVVPASTIDKRREQIWDILTKEGRVMKMGNFDEALMCLLPMLKDRKEDEDD